MGSGEDDDWGCWNWGETGDGTGGENIRLGFDGIVGPGEHRSVTSWFCAVKSKRV